MVRKSIFISTLLVVALCSVANAGGPEDSPIDTNPMGRPKGFGPGKTTTYAIWCDDDGMWHIKATAEKGKKVRFQGTIRVDGGQFTDGNFQELEKVKKKAGSDWAVVDRERKKLDYIFGNTGGMDGVDFKVSDSTKSVVFGLLVDGEPGLKNIVIGKTGVNPPKNPFALPAHPELDATKNVAKKKKAND